MRGLSAGMQRVAPGWSPVALWDGEEESTPSVHGPVPVPSARVPLISRSVLARFVQDPPLPSLELPVEEFDTGPRGAPHRRLGREGEQAANEARLEAIRAGLGVGNVGAVVASRRAFYAALGIEMPSVEAVWSGEWAGKESK